MRRHALVPDAQERIEVDRLAAIVLGLRVGPVAGIGALERRMLGDRVTQVTEPAFDRLRLAAIGLRPMDGAAQRDESPGRVFVAHLAAKSRLGAARHPLRRTAAALVVEPALGDAPL